MKILIRTEHGNVEAEMDDSSTAKAIMNILPIEGEAMTWGDEIYFDIPVRIDKENAKTEMEIGDLAYWVEGNSFCIFFGRTPASSNDRPVAASDVNPFGKTKGDLNILKKVRDGEKIVIEKL